jgi:hypothetical protein
MSGYSNVGNRGVYEAGDQRNAPESERNVEDPYNEGKENSHNNLDSSTYLFRRSSTRKYSNKIAEDERSIANRLAAEEVS